MNTTVLSASVSHNIRKTQNSILNTISICFKSNNIMSLLLKKGRKREREKEGRKEGKGRTHSANTFNFII